MPSTIQCELCTGAHSLVAPFVNREKWVLPVVFADGLDDFLNVATLPTVIIFNRNAKVSFRVNGIDPGTFPSSLTGAIEKALKASE